MKLIPSKLTVRTCQDCELWSPDKHMLTAQMGLCEKYAFITPRHLAVCIWRNSVERQELVDAIHLAYNQFKKRCQRPEIKGIRYEVPTQRTVQTDFHDDLEAQD